VIGAPIFTQIWSHVLPFSAYVKLQMEQMFMGSPVAVSLP
jgi:ABC-2 type transport system permease protein